MNDQAPFSIFIALNVYSSVRRVYSKHEYLKIGIKTELCDAKL